MDSKTASLNIDQSENTFSKQGQRKAWRIPSPKNLTL
jgi:hypothetical protein